MKVETQSHWDSSKHCPNIYFCVRPENDMEKAFMRSLYFEKGKVSILTDGYMMVDFYPKGRRKK